MRTLGTLLKDTGTAHDWGQPSSSLPQEDLLHGGDRSAIAGNAQLLPLLLQLREQGLKPEGKSHRGTDTCERGTRRPRRQSCSWFEFCLQH